MVQTAEKGTLSERVRREKEDLLSATPRIDIERIKFMLDAYQQTDGQPAIIRRAKLFDRLCSEKTIFIDNNPLAGTLTRHKYGGYPLPEFGARWLKKTDSFPLQRGRATATDEDKEWIGKSVDLWKDTSIYARTRQIMLERYQVDIGVIMKCGMGTELTPGGFIQVMPDYAKVLNSGLNGVMSDIRARVAALDTGNHNDFNKWHFYSAALTCLNGMVRLAHRYSSLAEQMAGQETQPEKKRQLQRIADACSWVPANPPRNFFEALQSVWFTVLGVWLENPTILMSPPLRFTQYMYPFYKKDREEGKITDEEVIELLQFYFIKLNGLAEVISPHGFAWSQSRLGQHLSIGGLTPTGEDATNELDYLVIEAQRQLMMPEPLVALQYHDRLSPDFLLRCVDLIRTGIGQPAFHHVDKAVARHLYHEKMPLEEARNFAISGCVQSNAPGYSMSPWEGAFNLTKMLELALNDGEDPLTGIQLGPKTGDADKFESYDELYGAVVKQMQHFIPLVRQLGRTAWNVARNFPVPFASAITNDCVEKGQDVMDGGARYHVANGVTFAAGVDLTNSLVAIKKLVFDEKKITMELLREALRTDFEGYENVQRMCLDAPKYGNDNDSVDSVAKQIYRLCYDEHQKFTDFLDRPGRPEAYSVAAHFATGRFTGALPNGRKARTPLTDGSVSATPGTDKNGPTALVKSAAKAVDTVKYGGNHLNMKFHPTALAGAEGARKFLSLIKTYFDLGGYHVQFNCVSSKTLKEAQLHPEEYRNLVVRVAGFSAFFIHLDKDVQDEIIKRTELTFN